MASGCCSRMARKWLRSASAADLYADRFETTVVRRPEWWGRYSGGHRIFGWRKSVAGPCKDATSRRPLSGTAGKGQGSADDTEYHDDRLQWINNDLVAFVSDRPVDANDTTRRKRTWAVNACTLAASVVVDMPFNIGHTDWQSSSGTPRESRTKDAVGKMK